jgi:hypothetical protein
MGPFGLENRLHEADFRAFAFSERFKAAKEPAERQFQLCE